MTSETGTAKQAKKLPSFKQVSSGYRSSPWAGAIIDGALLSWMAGIGLNKGFGVHVPFVAGWILLATAILLLFTAADQVACAYHKQAIAAAPYIAAGDVFGDESARQALDAQGFLDINAQLREGGVK